ncbi:MAG: 50S ribosomal protein L29 [Oscillospiraceae bacterium]
MKKKDLMTELREASVVELNERLTNLKSELFNLRFQVAVNQLENPMRIKAVKKEIARVQTILTERAAADSAKQ